MKDSHSFYFVSANGESRVYARLALPLGRPRALLQIIHGMAEHSGLYEEFIHYLTCHGLAVAIHDQIGHGLSVAPGQRYGFMAAQKGWQRALADIEYLRRVLCARWPNLPCFMLGHSMGSFLLRSYLIDYGPTSLAGAILCGSGQISPAMLGLGKLLIKLEYRRLGPRGLSPLLFLCIQGSYNRRFRPNRTPVDWLSRDQAKVDAYFEDKLCRKLPTVALYRDIFAALSTTILPENLQHMKKDLPLLLLSGSMDPVGQCGKSVIKLQRAFKAAGCINVQLKLYEGARHALLQEENRIEVYNDIIAWLSNNLSENDQGL